MNVNNELSRRSAFRSTVTILTIVVCLAWLAAPAFCGENIPSLSHGAVFENYVNVTLRTNPGDHCILFWGITNFRMTYNFPGELGGPLGMDLAPALPFTSTLDGGIAVNKEGVWSFRLPCLTEIRTFVDKIYFQAVSFRVEGSTITPTISELLEIDIRTPTNPKSNLRRALELLKKRQATEDADHDSNSQSQSYRGSTLYRIGRFEQNRSPYRYDPFARRIMLSR